MDYSDPDQELPQILEDYDIGEVWDSFRAFCINKYTLNNKFTPNKEIGFYTTDLYDFLLDYIKEKFNLKSIESRNVRKSSNVQKISKQIMSAFDAIFLIIKIWKDAGLIRLSANSAWHEIVE